MKDRYPRAWEWCGGCDRVELAIGIKCRRCGWRNIRKLPRTKCYELVAQPELPKLNMENTCDAIKTYFSGKNFDNIETQKKIPYILRSLADKSDEIIALYEKELKEYESARAADGEAEQ